MALSRVSAYRKWEVRKFLFKGPARALSSEDEVTILSLERTFFLSCREWLRGGVPLNHSLKEKNTVQYQNSTI
jgi:hypothetical protein